MQTKLLVKANGRDTFAVYDTKENAIFDETGKNTISYEGLYAVTQEGKFGLIKNKDEIEEYLETYRILSDN